MAGESEQLAYLREHQPALEDVLVKAVGATVSARSDDPVHFLVTYLAEAVGLVVRSRPSKRLREIGFKAMVIGATVREVVGLRQWIPESSAGIQDDAGGLDPILPERYKSIARDKTFSQRVVHPAVRVTGHEAELSRMLEHGTQHWEFDSLRLTVVSGGHPLLALGWSLFERHRLRDELGLTSEVVLGFLSRVETLYNQVPYHNAEHACDVTHSFHYLLMTDALRDLATSPIDMFCCIVAAICHDLNHDGRNNAFHAASDSPIARRHAYDSPLERHHLATTFETLARPECNLLASFTPAVRRDVRDRLTALVLATDFALHKQTLDDVGYMLDRRAPPPSAIPTGRYPPAALPPPALRPARSHLSRRGEGPPRASPPREPPLRAPPEQVRHPGGRRRAPPRHAALLRASARAGRPRARRQAALPQAGHQDRRPELPFQGARLRPGVDRPRARGVLRAGDLPRHRRPAPRSPCLGAPCARRATPPPVP